MDDPAAGRDRFSVPSTPYSETYRDGREPVRSADAEVVSRMPNARGDMASERDEYRYDQERERPRLQQRPEQRPKPAAGS